MHRLLIPLIGVCFTIQAQAFPCFLTMVKDSCWTDYNVTIVAADATTGKQITSVLIPQGQSWTRVQFNCQPKDSIEFVATFTPVFWENDKGKSYAGQRQWTLPEAIKAGDTAWNIPMCYPTQFSQVPLPPGADNNCKCNMEEIPLIKPQ